MVAALPRRFEEGESDFQQVVQIILTTQARIAHKLREQRRSATKIKTEYCAIEFE